MTFSRSTPLVILFAVMTLLSSHSYAHSVQEGVHFNTLPTPINSESDSSRIVKYFSFSCQPCQLMSQFLPQLEHLTRMAISKEHVVFNQGTKQAAYLYYSAKEQNSSSVNLSLMAALFDAVQSQNTETTTLTTLYQSYGLQAPDRLNDTQKQHISTQIKHIESVMKISNISSIPAFVVDGKYIVKLEGHRSIEDLGNTMNYLLTLTTPTV